MTSTVKMITSMVTIYSHTYNCNERDTKEFFFFKLKYQVLFHLKEYLITFRMSHAALKIYYSCYQKKQNKTLNQCYC